MSIYFTGRGHSVAHQTCLKLVWWICHPLENYLPVSHHLRRLILDAECSFVAFYSFLPFSNQFTILFPHLAKIRVIVSVISATHWPQHLNQKSITHNKLRKQMIKLSSETLLIMLRGFLTSNVSIAINPLIRSNEIWQFINPKSIKIESFLTDRSDLENSSVSIVKSSGGIFKCT